MDEFSVFKFSPFFYSCALFETTDSRKQASDEIVVFLTENGSAAGARYPAFVFLSFCLFLFLCVLLIARADCSPRWGHMCAQKHAMVRKPWFAKKKGKVNLEILPKKKKNLRGVRAAPGDFP